MATITEIINTLKNLTNAKVTQAEIARALNVTSATVNIRVKKNSQLNINELKKIGKYYNVQLVNIPFKKENIISVNNNINISYADKIKDIRMILQLSCSDLSKMLSFPEQNIVDYENGSIPTIDFLEQLYKILNINPIWFFSGKAEMFLMTKPINIKDEIKKTFKEMINSGELNKDNFI